MNFPLLSLLIFIRSSELRFARWDEIDFARAIWTIPAEREAIERYHMLETLADHDDELLETLLMDEQPSLDRVLKDLTDEARAGALWTFLQAQAPRFTFDQALEVVQSLRIDPREDHKTLAKRLRKALQERRIALKHVNALHAAARLNGHASWHTDDEAAVARLRFEVIESGPQMWQSEFASWSELALALRAWADKLHASGQLPLGVLAMNFDLAPVSCSS